jgi:hypothetical protein
MSTTDMYKYITGERFVASKIPQPIPGTAIVDIVGTDGITPIAFSDIKLYDDALGTTELVLDTDFTLQRLDSRLSGLEGESVYRAVQIINPIYQADVFYADFDAVGGYAQYPPVIIYPVGATYTQYATEDSATANTAMPATLSPASLFGGTWALLYDDEGIDFHTEGYDTTAHGAYANRTAAGIQEDNFQAHLRDMDGGTDSANKIGVSSSAGASGTGNRVRINIYDYKIFTSEYFAEGTNGTPRRGKRTTDRNRWMRLWERTA